MRVQGFGGQKILEQIVRREKWGGRRKEVALKMVLLLPPLNKLITVLQE